MDMNLTAIGFVLDKSGSMSSIRDDTIGGFNEFLKTQKNAEGKAKISFAQFSTDYELIHDFVDLEEIPNLTEETFIPSGMTALLDAIGKMIDGLGVRLSEMPEEERPGNVIVAVMTDGHENVSQNYTKEKIFEMIQHQTDVYKWEFIFLGAEKDSISVGQSYGFSVEKSVSYSVNNAGHTLCHLGGKLADYRTSVTRGGVSAKMNASHDLGYSQSDRNEIG